jgi:hypothetical protein
MEMALANIELELLLGGSGYTATGQGSTRPTIGGDSNLQAVDISGQRQ